MTIKKYLKPILLFFIYINFWIGLSVILHFFFPSVADLSLARFIPSNTMEVEIPLLFIIILPLAGTIGYYLGGYLLAPLFLYVHKRIFGSRLKYGIQYKKEVRSINVFYKSFFPIMLSMNLTSLIVDVEIAKLVISPELITLLGSSNEASALIRILGMFILLPASYLVSMFLFSAIWFLKNAGIVYSNEAKVESVAEPHVIRSVGGWFHTYLKGYAGISVVITYSTVIYVIITYFISGDEYAYAFLTLVLWFSVLVMLLLATIPILISNEVVREKSGKYLRKFARKWGIKERAEVQLILREDKDIEIPSSETAEVSMDFPANEKSIEIFENEKEDSDLF